ncbi:MAG TPA: ribonuclease HII [Steroidobacteraceae bacterium]|nr:ribonuclease HII [Steroidobacteraceae bacterium]
MNAAAIARQPELFSGSIDESRAAAHDSHGNLVGDSQTGELSNLLAGVDEAGRGPLAGPVVAAAVILDPRRPIRGIDDSKVLTDAEREALAARIRERAIAWSVAWADAEEIDSINILQATFLAMRRALCGLRIAPAHVQIDGNRAPSMLGLGHGMDRRCRLETIVEGDARIKSIGAASILAKTTRDAMMRELDIIYPGYGFAAHKGYAVPAHYRALDKLGPCVIHRMSFEPVRAAAVRLSISMRTSFVVTIETTPIQESLSP